MALSTTRGQFNSYGTSTTGGSVPEALVIREVGNFIPEVRQSETPMLGLVKQKGTKEQLVWEYGEGDLAPRQDQLAEALDNSETGVDVDNGAYFQVWDLIKVDDEVMLVTSISTNTLTVTRGWGSTAAATHEDNATVYILGPAVPEGVDAPRSPITRGHLFETGPQIFEYTWEFTHRGEIVPDYEVKTNKFQHELKKKMKEAAEDLNDLLLNGIYNAGDASGTNPSTMKGLREATTTNVTDLSDTPLELIDFLEAIQPVSNRVGQSKVGKTVMCDHFTKRVINSWFQGSRRAGKSDAKLRLHWDEIDCDFGTFKIVVNYQMREDEIFVWNPQDSGLYTMEGGKWSTGIYETQGWYRRGFLRGDYGAIYEADSRRLRLHNYSTTRADYPLLDVAA